MSLVYGHGDFPREHLSSVHAIWAIYLIGLGPTLFGRVFSRAILVLKNTKLLMIMGIANFILKFGLNLLLIRPMGVEGLALSTTVTYSLLAVVFMFCFLRARSGSGGASMPEKGQSSIGGNSLLKPTG